MAERSVNLRRSTRLKTPSKQATEDSTKGVQRTRRSRKISSSSSDGEQTPDELARELEDELKIIDEDVQKPTELYTEEQDVSGASMYHFPTSSKSGAMAQKAALSRSAATPQTPKHAAKQKNLTDTAQTPHSVRNKFKKQLVSLARNISGESSSESESVSEENEYVPSVDEESDDSEEGEEVKSSEGSESDVEDNKKQIRKTPAKVAPSRLSTSKQKRNTRVTYNDYHLETDDYFEMQSEKVLTSDRTLGRLVNPRMDEEKLQKLLSKQSFVSKEHKEAIRSLSRDYRALFPMWHCILEEGYSLLLHGLGSKRILINDFHKETLSDHPTLVVNGFFPSLTLKEILDGITTDLLGLQSPTNPNECLSLIESTLRENPEDRLYLLVHNIDGVMLRSNKAQDTLSILASIPNLSLIASVDHINTPLIWDNVKHSRYNFCWWDVTTMLPYDAETSFESSIMVQKSGALALSSLLNVFLSLTSNARAIYVLLIKHQLEHATSDTYPGMLLKDLYSNAREAFLVSSDTALRAQLTEFIDHKLVRSKRNYDGAEYLSIPLDNTLLKQFLDQQETA
ncbi:origin recognition complex subunit 2 isoform X1 [Neodiprion virginianus]|uniref:origin recognition complex subunit 2 isoform X1 n=2 Tax=Neodiprion virginianus TaxID=2961670 RepID=UPI001EE69ABE|nr:origin recognition complex subunit 2 isoform X1 [Neodiprion virginianus]XP_046617486.1 origin recognition complex subunit 2 isoform X1 [Neodiprion virginianus]